MNNKTRHISHLSVSHTHTNSELQKSKSTITENKLLPQEHLKHLKGLIRSLAFIIYSNTLSNAAFQWALERLFESTLDY